MIVHLQLARLHAGGGGTAAPAAADDIDGLAHVLGVPLPPTIRAIYEDHEAEESGSGTLRLMSPSEAAGTITALRDFGVPFDDRELGTFWTDDNSNYVGVFASGDLAGRVFKIDHEEPSPEPCWRSVESYYDALLDARDSGLDWWDLATDYPREPADQTPEDDALARRLFALYHERPDSPVGQRAVHQALALSSATHAAQVISLLRSDDMWIQERAVQILGHWRWEPAVASIAEVVRNGQHNGRTAGIHALKQIGSPAAGAALRSLSQELGDSYRVHF
ncbi:hypothetical protein AB0M46_38070 [Dactylosporangium sp. NPDC051485]|uniref:HEAT repeat domain-containing protein n=1 Tax=Dactylosporangium sp. NPDC051485 TaxID=3154846 RepID=UPI003449A571